MFHGNVDGANLKYGSQVQIGVFKLLYSHQFDLEVDWSTGRCLQHRCASLQVSLHDREDPRGAAK